MRDLHFAGDTEDAKTQHVRARSKKNYREFIQTVHEEGKDCGFDRSQLIAQFQSQWGETQTAGEETNSMLKKFGLLNRQNEPTIGGEVAGELFKRFRADIAQEILIQHFRMMPTIAYTMDILRQAAEPISTETIHKRMRRYNTTDSSSQSNSIGNVVNLLQEYDIIKEEGPGYVSISRKLVPPGAVLYGTFLLTEMSGTVQANELRARLPVLTHSTADTCEDLVQTVMDRSTTLKFRTDGDPSRLEPFGGVFEVYTDDSVTVADIQKDLL